MGTGSWTSKGFADYTISTKCVASIDDFVNCSNVSTQDVFKVNTLSDSQLYLQQFYCAGHGLCLSCGIF